MTAEEFLAAGAAERTRFAALLARWDSECAHRFAQRVGVALSTRPRLRPMRWTAAGTRRCARCGAVWP